MGQAESSSVRRVPRNGSEARSLAAQLAYARAQDNWSPSNPYMKAYDEEYSNIFKPIVRDSRGNFIARDESGMILFDTEAFEQITAFEFAMQFSPDRVKLLMYSQCPAFRRLLNRYYERVLGAFPTRSLPHSVKTKIDSTFHTARVAFLEGDTQTPERQTFRSDKRTRFNKNNVFFNTWIDLVKEAWADKVTKRQLLNDIKNNINDFYRIDDYYKIVRRLRTDVGTPTFDQLDVGIYGGKYVDYLDCGYCYRYFYVVPAVGLRDADGLPIEFEVREGESEPYRSLPKLMANAPVNKRVALTDPGFLAFLADPRVTPTLHTNPMMNYLRYVKEILIPYAQDKPNIRVPLVNPDMIYRQQSPETVESSKRPDLEVATEGMRHALSREQGGFDPSAVTPTRPSDEHESQIPARQWSLWTSHDAVMASLPTAGLGDSYFGRRRIMSRMKFIRLYKRLKGVSSGVASRKYDACMRLLL